MTVVVCQLLALVSAAAPAWPVTAVVAQAEAPRESPAPPHLSAEDYGRLLVGQLLHQQTESLWAMFGPAARRQVGSEAALRAFARKVATDFGDEQRVSAERVSKRGALMAYSRLSTFSRYALGVEIELLWDSQGRVASLTVQPAFREAPTEYLTYQTKTNLRLPLDGPWYVLWGGHDWEDNRHASVPDMRFAYDLLIYRGSSTCKDPCATNNDYYAWARVVRAPAAGVVTEVVNDVVDNAPNQPSPLTLFGNYVVLDHHNGEYSLLGHFMRGSIRVWPGLPVRAGQVLGRVGSSGVSTEPHLHYQLMNEADYRSAHGLPAAFVDFLANGAFVRRAELKRGQLVQPALKPK